MQSLKLKKNALSNVVSLREQAAITGTHEVRLLSNASAVSSQMAKATSKLRQARDMIST